MVDFVTYPHPALSTNAKRRPLDDAMLVAGQKLLSAATEANAYGLAAAHIGLIEPVIVVSISSDPAERDYRVMYIPRASAVAADTEVGTEGSVSLPGIEVPVVRPVWAEIVYETAQDVTETLRLEGFAARVVLHEIDQMEGLFFLRRVSSVKRDTALRKFQKMTRL